MIMDSEISATATADSHAGIGSAEALITHDALLQASRRLDWRFLLPDPTLRHVAYVGPAHQALVGSLQLVSASLTLFNTLAACTESPGPYDVVVARGPSYKALKVVRELVRPGGWLYVENDRLFWSRRWWRRGARPAMPKEAWLHSPAGYVAVLERLGFADVQSHWHWPDFEACTKIIPLDDLAALRFALAQAGGGPQAWLSGVLGHWLLSGGRLADVVPCYSLVARRDSE